jgi:aminoglycoside phosphotransferase (APT) family kinase protein
MTTGPATLPDIASDLGGPECAVRLEAFLQKVFPDVYGPVEVDRAVGGMSNPTFLLRAGNWSAVLRKQPSAAVVKSAHAIDREFRVLSALQGTEVPVPKPLLYHAETDILDTPFYVMERLEGRIFDAYALPGLASQDRRACYEDMCRVMAAMHRLDWASLGLADYGRPGNYFARQFSRWTEQWPNIRGGTDNPYIDRLIEWLSPRIPNSETLALCHGDFRIANLMFHATEPKVIGVLDWELSTLGHPLVDVGFNTQAWLLTPDENGGIRGLDLAVLGIPSEADYLELYYRLSGSPERMSTFHKVFAMFRAAVGSAGIAARGRDGSSVSQNAAETGTRLSLAYARRGVELIEAGS